MNTNLPPPESPPPAPARRTVPPLSRLLLVAAIVGAVAGLFLYAGGWLTPRRLTPAKMVNAFEQVNAVHPGFRRNHAKGVGISGYFVSNGNGQALSKAVVFAPGKVPVLGRFALAVGQPQVPDSPQAVRSMALLFQLPNGEEWRTGMNNIPVFVVNSPHAFYELILAGAPDPATHKPVPAKMGEFLSRHPESEKAFQLVRAQPPTTGFADSAYNSLDAFRFTNSKGEVANVRWSMVPLQGADPAVPADAGPNGLFDALVARLHGHALQWRLVVTIGQPGDPTNDATLPWPPDRVQVDVGTLTVDQVASEDTSAARDINFDPLILPSGIAGSDDPLLSARSAAYAQSFTRREGEPKSPSAVSPAETTR